MANGADTTIDDVRGLDTLDSAKQADSIIICDYIYTSVLTKNYCPKFYNGIFEQGVTAAIGVFLKRFQDMQIAGTDTQGNQTLLNALMGIPLDNTTINDDPT